MSWFQVWHWTCY